MARRVFDDLAREGLLVRATEAKEVSVDANSPLEAEDNRQTRSLAT
jgi:hypothetical protein